MEERLVEGVRCTISNCEYWADQNRCKAGQILITHSSPMIMADKHGMNADQIQETPADEVGETCCYTFEPED